MYAYHFGNAFSPPHRRPGICRRRQCGRRRRSRSTDAVCRLGSRRPARAYDRPAPRLRGSRPRRQPTSMCGIPRPSPIAVGTDPAGAYSAAADDVLRRLRGQRCARRDVRTARVRARRNISRQRWPIGFHFVDYVVHGWDVRSHDRRVVRAYRTTSSQAVLPIAFAVPMANSAPTSAAVPSRRRGRRRSERYGPGPRSSRPFTGLDVAERSALISAPRTVRRARSVRSSCSPRRRIEPT